MDRRPIKKRLPPELLPSRTQAPPPMDPTGEKVATRRAIAFIAQDRQIGRKTTYREEFDQLVYELRMLGAPIEAVGRVLNVQAETLQRWQGLYPSFAEAWQQGGDIADTKVVMAVYHKACGFSRFIDKTEYNKKTGELMNWTEEVYYPPDTSAAIFWLTNRRRGHWMVSHHQELTGANGAALSPPSINVNFTNVANASSG
jgi:hypothetical protein